MGMPARSDQRKRRPRSATRLLVPRTPLASQADPKKPAHSPSSVDTMYQVGGSLSLVMALSEASLPSMAAATATKTAARIWPPRKPRAAKRSHIQADDRESGAAPAASWSPSETSAPAEAGRRARRRPPAGPGRGAGPGGGRRGRGPSRRGAGRGRRRPSGPAGGDHARWRPCRPGDPAVGGGAGVRTLFGPLDHPPTIPTDPGPLEAGRPAGGAMRQTRPGANSMKG